MVKCKYLDFKVIRKHSTELRNNMPDSKKLLWKQLRNRQLLRTVIELDGLIHQDTEEFDRFRDIEMKEKGIHALRLKNNEMKILTKVLQNIKSFLNLIL